MQYNSAGAHVRRIISFTIVAVLYGQQVSIEPRERTAPKTPPNERRAQLKIDTSLVLVPVTVTDKLGRPVLGLEKENFRVFDNKVEQSVAQLAMEDDPVAVGFMFDISGSIGGAM